VFHRILAEAMIVLVIDDDDELRETVREVLEDQGFTTAGAADGEQGLAYLRQSPRPDVILLDLSMPVMDGATFRQLQRADPALADIPVILFSAAAGLDEKVRELGVDAVIKKPISLAQLVACVSSTATSA
jgi:CheY-like chemotaxis protein